MKRNIDSNRYKRIQVITSRQIQITVMETMTKINLHKLEERRNIVFYHPSCFKFLNKKRKIYGGYMCRECVKTKLWSATKHKIKEVT